MKYKPVLLGILSFLPLFTIAYLAAIAHTGTEDYLPLSMGLSLIIDAVAVSIIISLIRA